jgi:hypothetical protein
MTFGQPAIHGRAEMQIPRRATGTNWSTTCQREASMDSLRHMYRPSNLEYSAQALRATEAVRLVDDTASRLRGYGAGSSWIVQPYVARTWRVAGAETHG